MLYGSADVPAAPPEAPQLWSGNAAACRQLMASVFFICTVPPSNDCCGAFQAFNDLRCFCIPSVVATGGNDLQGAPPAHCGSVADWWWCSSSLRLLHPRERSMRAFASPLRSRQDVLLGQRPVLRGEAHRRDGPQLLQRHPRRCATAAKCEAAVPHPHPSSDRPHWTRARALCCRCSAAFAAPTGRPSNAASTRPGLRRPTPQRPSSAPRRGRQRAPRIIDNHQPASRLSGAADAPRAHPARRRSSSAAETLLLKRCRRRRTAAAARAQGARGRGAVRRHRGLRLQLVRAPLPRGDRLRRRPVEGGETGAPGSAGRRRRRGLLPARRSSFVRAVESLLCPAAPGGRGRAASGVLRALPLDVEADLLGHGQLR